MSDYMPHFYDEDGNRWGVLSIDFCIDFGGRQAQIECQRENANDKFPKKSFVYYFLTKEFRQWDSSELQSSIPCLGDFTESLHEMFKIFDKEKQ